MIAETESVSTPSIENEGGSEILIELFNPNGFEIRNAPMVLRIGEAEFSFIGGLAPDLFSAVFTVTPLEFEGLSDGDPISFLYGPYETEPYLFFGRLQKSQIEERTLRLDPHFVMTKENAAQRLSELQASIEDAEVTETLEDAIGAIERSLEPELWLDLARLDPIKGEVVFDHELEALERLMELDNSERFPLGDKAMLWGIIRQIVLTDRGMAAFAIENRSGGLLSTLDVQRAKGALLQGDVASLEGDFICAVERYRDAWLLTVPAE